MGLKQPLSAIGVGEMKGVILQWSLIRLERGTGVKVGQPGASVSLCLSKLGVNLATSQANFISR